MFGLLWSQQGVWYVLLFSSPHRSIYFFGRRTQEHLFGFSDLLVQEEVLTLVFLDPLVTEWFLDLPSCPIGDMEEMG